MCFLFWKMKTGELNKLWHLSLQKIRARSISVFNYFLVISQTQKNKAGENNRYVRSDEETKIYLDMIQVLLFAPDKPIETVQTCIFLFPEFQKKCQKNTLHFQQKHGSLKPWNQTYTVDLASPKLCIYIGYFPTYLSRGSDVFFSGGGRNLVFFEEVGGSFSAGGGRSTPDVGEGDKCGPAWNQNVRQEWPIRWVFLSRSFLKVLEDWTI